MEKTAVAFAPGHISGYFKRVVDHKLENTGSIGAGIVIDRGVTAQVTAADGTYIQIVDPLNKKSIVGGPSSKLIEGILSSLGVTAVVKTVSDMPIGNGFGMSSAAVLSVLTAANCVFELGFMEEDIIMRAHIAEIMAGTGLGDVAAAAKGGVVIRTTPGILGVQNRFYPEKQFYAITFGHLSTKDIIGSAIKMERINSAFPTNEHPPPDLSSFMLASRKFAEASCLITKEVRRVLDDCDDANILSSMTMLGNGVFSTNDEAVPIFERYEKVIPLKVNKVGPVIIRKW